MRRTVTPGCRHGHSEVNRPRRRAFVDRQHQPVYTAKGRSSIAFGMPLGRVENYARNRQTDGGLRNTRTELRSSAFLFGDDLICGAFVSGRRRRPRLPASYGRTDRYENKSRFISIHLSGPSLGIRTDTAVARRESSSTGSAYTLR